MKSEHQNGKTEPASTATGWDFIIGKFGSADQLCNAAINDGQANLTLIPRNSELLGELVTTTQPPKEAVK